MDIERTAKTLLLLEDSMTLDQRAELVLEEHGITDVTSAVRNLLHTSSEPNPHLLSRWLMRREAVLSSRIEGTQASLSELILFEMELSVAGAARDDVREVYNYVAAVDAVLDPHRRLPLSLSTLLDAHRVLLTGVRGYAMPGEFRRSQNWIGRPGCTLDEAVYTPPPPERIWECLDPFEKYLHADRALPALMAIAAFTTSSKRSTRSSMATDAWAAC